MVVAAAAVSEVALPVVSLQEAAVVCRPGEWPPEEVGEVPNVSRFHLTAIPTVSNTTSLIADCVCVKVSRCMGKELTSYHSCKLMDSVACTTSQFCFHEFANIILFDDYYSHI